MSKKTVTLYCIFHIEDGEPMLLQAFSDVDEMNEWLFENEHSDYNLSIEQTKIKVSLETDGDYDEAL